MTDRLVGNAWGVRLSGGVSLERPIAPIPYDYLAPVKAFTVVSDDVVDGAPLSEEHVFNGMGVSGANLSPHLSWSGFPTETESFVITCLDPDAPTGSGFWHWVVIDVPKAVTTVPRGAGASDDELPGGFHVATDFGLANYGGAAPPQGDHPHRYLFAIHAVDVPTLGLDASARPAVVGFTLAFHTLARAVIAPTYRY